METQKPLLKDEDGEEVDVHMYRSMIGSLMYLTSSRPDIMFAVCACARYQVNPKVSHLHAVKRIFRYLKGQLKFQPKFGLWYLKDSPFDLVSYTDSDYARASLDMKSTTGGVSTFWYTVKAKTINGEQQLHALVDGKKIIITESSGRRDLQLDDEEDEAIYKKLGDSLVRAATTASSLEAEQDSGNINKTQSKATPNESSSLRTALGGSPKVLDLEKTKTTQHNEIASLKRRAKKLEKKNRSRTYMLKRLYKVGLTARVESSDNEESLGKDVLGLKDFLMILELLLLSAASVKLVLHVKIEENILSSYYCLCSVNAAGV
ncbi:hypothetical protein Tco_0851952 [Tanacetum coccineum]